MKYVKHVPVELSHDPVARLPLAPLEGLLDWGVAQPVETPLHQTCVRERYFFPKKLLKKLFIRQLGFLLSLIIVTVLHC
jgi:hypothetical protein